MKLIVVLIIITSFLLLRCEAFQDEQQQQQEQQKRGKEKDDFDVTKLLERLGSDVQTLESQLTEEEKRKLAQQNCSIACTFQLAELKKDFSNLLKAYFLLCDEIRHISGHLIVHEQALKNIGLYTLSNELSRRQEGNVVDSHRPDHQEGPHGVRISQGSKVNISEESKDSHSHEGEIHQHVKVTRKETKVMRKQRVVNNGTHTIIYTTVQKIVDGVPLPPETTEQVVRNQPDSESIGAYEKRRKSRKRRLHKREIDSDNDQQPVNRPSNEPFKRRGDVDITPDEDPKFEEITEAPVVVSESAPTTEVSQSAPSELPKGKQQEDIQSNDSLFGECPNDPGCSNFQGCSQLHKVSVTTEEFKQKYLKWVQRLIGQRNIGDTFILYPQKITSRRSVDEDYHQGKQSIDYNIQEQYERKGPQNEEAQSSTDYYDKAASKSIYATCDMQPNRHIPLLLQQDVEGRINMWQNFYGGPVFMQIKLRGLKTRLNSRQSNSRFKRESNILPNHYPYNDLQYDQRQGSSACVHGFHVHEFGNLTKGCQFTGPHYNPRGLLHGGPMDIIRHEGDLGNLVCNENGTVETETSFVKISLSGEHSIIGRSLVIHSQPDDYGRNPSNIASATNGNSGPKIACCVIEKVDRLPRLAFDGRPTDNSNIL